MIFTYYRGVVLVPFVLCSWLLYDYNVTMAGRVRAARVRCRWSSLRGVAGSDLRRRGRRCDWSEAGAGGVPLLPLLIRWRARLVAASVALYYYIILCGWCRFVNAFSVYAAGAAGLAAGRMICAGREKVPVFLAFSENSS